MVLRTWKRSFGYSVGGGEVLKTRTNRLKLTLEKELRIILILHKLFISKLNPPALPDASSQFT